MSRKKEFFMTEESLQEMQEKVRAAEDIKRQISDLIKVIERGNGIKMWGVCLYYDEEGDDRLYADLPVEEVERFFEEFIIKGIEKLEKEFSAL